MSSSSSAAAFVVTCPGCGQRLRFALAADGPPRVRVQCATCNSEFRVRRPGTAPLPDAGASGISRLGAAAGASGAAGSLALSGAAATGDSLGLSAADAPPTVVGIPVESGTPPPPKAPPARAAAGHADSTTGIAGAAGTSAPVAPPTPAADGAGAAATGAGAAAAGAAADPASTTPPKPWESVLPAIVMPAPGARLPVFAAETIVAGRYRVVRFLAQGGMGEVYEVEDRELRERVALKTVRPEVEAGSLAVERFRREIQLARKVTHPNVCRIFDVSHHRPGGDGQETIFLTMELLAGETLAERLRRGGPMAPSEALPIARQICLGLAAAHEVGIIHRDLKPGNVVLVPSRTGVRAVVTDFGLARLEAGHDPGALTLTTAGGLVGTPAYLAPEQLEGGEITTAVDIYALGIVLYEMATGTVPFLGDSVLATAVKRLRETPVSPRVHAPHLDSHWEAAILRCLERDPADRFATAMEVAASLAGAAAAERGPAAGGELAAPTVAWQTTQRPAATTAAGQGSYDGPATGIASATAGGQGSLDAGIGDAVAGRQTPSGAPAADQRQGGSAPRSPDAAGAAGTGPGAASPGSGWSGSGISEAGAGMPAPWPAGAGPSGQATAAGATVPTAAPPALPVSPVHSRRRLATFALVALILVSFAVAFYRFLGWREARAEAERRLGLPSAEITPRRSVAVLGFQDLSGAAGSAWLSPALAEMLSTELGAGGALRVVAGEDVARVKLELQLGQPASLARDTLARIRKLLGSDAVVAGSYLMVGSAGGRQIRLDLRLQDALTGETTTLTETGTEAGLFQLVARAGERLRRELRAGSAPASHPALAANPEAARLYSEGMQKLHLFEPVRARDLLAQAVAADPGSAPAHSGLAAAWAALGYDGKARAEAKTALDLSAGLPEQERLLIEGRFREATGEWERAVDIYRRLFTLYPDSLDYAMRLAAAEIAAGHPQDALATTTALRALPAPSRDDPRIDLAEATAAAATSDFQRQHAAAGRAAGRAAALGARLLVAQARLLDCLALRNLGRAEDALAACAEGQRLHAAAGDRSGVAEALTDAANVHFDRGDLPGAQALYEQALATYREIGNRGAEGRALNNIAVVLRSQGDLERARQLFEQVLAIAREIDSRGAEAYALNNLAGVMLRRGDLDGAAALYQQSLILRRQLADAAGEAYALDNLGVALRRRGDLPGAWRRHQEALAIRRRTGQKIGEVASLNNLGSVLFDQGDLQGALARFQEALAASRAIGSQTASAHALFGRGEVLSRQGKLDEARRDHQAALGLRTGLGEKGTAADSRLALAELDFAAAAAPPVGRMAELAAQAEAVAEELARQGAADQQARALSLAALAARAAGQEPRARLDIDRAAALLRIPPGGTSIAAPPATANTPPPAAAQDLRARLTVALRAATLLPAAEQQQAAAALTAVRDEATRTGLLEIRLEADLATAERTRAAAHLGTPMPTATAAAADPNRAAALAIEARIHGFALIAARAATLAGSPSTAPSQAATRTHH